MKQKLKTNIKRMMDALAYQHAADFMPYQEKLAVLGVTHSSRNSGRLLPDAVRRSAGRVAWLTDGTDQSLDYALEVCSRQQAGLDLILHGQALTNRDSVTALESTVTKAGITHQSFALQNGTLSELTDFLLTHANLIYLVASIGNPLACALKENKSAATQNLRIPLVLFEATQPQPVM